MSVQKGPQGMGQRDPSCLESEAAMWWSGICPKDSQGGSRGFWELLAETEAEVGGDLRSPRMELSQVTSAVSGHRAPWASHTQSPDGVPSWQQGPLKGQQPRQASSRSGGQEEVWGWSFWGRGMLWRASGRGYNDYRTGNVLASFPLPFLWWEGKSVMGQKLFSWPSNCCKLSLWNTDTGELVTV